MAKSKDRPVATLTKKQTQLLGIAIVVLLGSTLSIGYLFGIFVSEPSNQIRSIINPKLPVIEPNLLVEGGKVIDPEIVKRETSTNQTNHADFTFHEKLKLETAPAKPLPKSDTNQELIIASPRIKNNKAPSPSDTSKSNKVTKKGRNFEALANKFAIQLASFKARADANILLHRLRKHKYKGYIRVFKQDGDTWYRVRVGEFSSHDTAQTALLQINSDFNYRSIVVKYN
ncbi:MAG TPA: SPOR domain-containing protein [Nitrospinota bacterium]|nr:SPOR domain-containing protein [Nitrospinota bacterium]|tara:strand:+ start:2844 stop:3530 length:687 start_codon:yes stop_codon:yes gene_type:complete